MTGKAKAQKTSLKKKTSAKSNPRKDYGDNANIALVSEVGGDCPKCGKRLLNSRSKNIMKDYELAHIYPLNPKAEEILLLQNEERLSTDPNSEDNIIALCIDCHHKLDNPRTIKDYRELVEIKKNILAFNIEKAEWIKHPLTDEITHVISSLITLDAPVGDSSIEYNPKTIDDKTKPEIPNINRERIKNDVRLYFSHIKAQLKRIDATSPGTANYISLQIKTYYASLKKRGVPKLEIFNNISTWICTKTSSESLDACKAITSFFVQNCEVFEEKI